MLIKKKNLSLDEINQVMGELKDIINHSKHLTFGDAVNPKITTKHDDVLDINRQLNNLHVLLLRREQQFAQDVFTETVTDLLSQDQLSMDQLKSVLQRRDEALKK